MKRDIELASLTVGHGQASGRAYVAQDKVVITAFGIASGLISVLVLCLYIDTEIVRELYHDPWILWLACPILGFGIGRLWILANRGAVDNDPVKFVLRDPTSYILAFGLAAVGLMAKVGAQAIRTSLFS